MVDENRVADIKVGAFVLAALAIFVSGSLWIAGSALLVGSRIDYSVLLKDTAGLQSGDRVRISGVAVGRIRDVELRPEEEWPVVLQVEIKPDVEIKSDASAQIATSGLLGTSYLRINAGSPGAARLPEGGEIRASQAHGLDSALARVDEISEKAIGLLEQASGIMDTLARKIGPILNNLDTLMSEGNVAEVRRILANLRAVSEDTGPKLGALLDRVNAIAVQLEGGVEGLPELTAELQALVQDVRRAMGPEGARLSSVLASAEGSLNSADRALAVIGGSRGEIEETLRDLRDTVANLKTFSQQIKERPYSLMRIRHEPERRPGQPPEPEK